MSVQLHINVEVQTITVVSNVKKQERVNFGGNQFEIIPWDGGPRRSIPWKDLHNILHTLQKRLYTESSTVKKTW